MSRSASGSTKAKNTIVATPAAKKLGHRIAPMRCASGRGGWSKRGAAKSRVHGVAAGGARLAGCWPWRCVRQRPDVGGDQARAGLAEQLAVRRHHAVAAVGDGLAAALACCCRTASSRRSRSGAPSSLVALAVGAVAGHAHAVVERLALRGHVVVLQLVRVGQRAHVGDRRSRPRSAPPMPVSTLPHSGITPSRPSSTVCSTCSGVPPQCQMSSAEVGIADRALRRGAVAGRAGVVEDRAAERDAPSGSRASDVDRLVRRYGAKVSSSFASSRGLVARVLALRRPLAEAGEAAQAAGTRPGSRSRRRW